MLFLECARMKVLVVDDSPAVRRIVRILFEDDTAFEVCGEAENGREGIEKAQELFPDLIVMDLSMPVMNGPDATRAIRRIMPNVPILLLSGHSDLLTVNEARSVGISVVVSKTELSMLVEAARAVLRQNAA
jgi:DNA-binding NarL/FixJ family response regulator